MSNISNLMKYPMPGIAAVNHGAQTDARLHLAVDLAKTPGYLRHYTALVDGVIERTKGMTEAHADEFAKAAGLPDTFGEFACVIADEVYAAAAARGWLAPLSTDPELSETDRAHVERSAGAQALSQVHGQKVGMALQAGMLRDGRGQIVS